MKTRKNTTIGGIFTILVILGLVFTACSSPMTSPMTNPEVNRPGNTYTVNYNKNASDAAGTMANSVFTVGAAETLRPNAYTRNEYEFTGWAISASGTVAYTDGQSVRDIANAGRTITLYAVWRALPPPDEIPAVGGTLAQELAWIKNNAASNAVYKVDVTALSESLSPQDLTYTGKNNITIQLKGIGGSVSTVEFSGDGSLFSIGSGVTLILDDNLILKGKSSNTSSLVMIKSGGTFIMNGSKIIGNTNTNGGIYGSGVSVYGGTFMMNGGEISGNTHSYTLNSGGGGGVDVANGTFTMNGGKISGNTAQRGGGVYVDSDGSFTMNGGEISGNTAATYNGGGVYVYSGSFTMKGGKISGNTAGGALGGGVYVEGSNGTFTMEGGKITGNTASYYGGGVGVSGTFTMNSGEISGNTASYYGGGVYVYGGVFEKNGGTITGYSSDAVNGNVAKNSSGAVQNNNGHAVYAGSKRKENTAGPGVYLYYNGNTSVWNGAWDY